MYDLFEELIISPNTNIRLFLNFVNFLFKLPLSILPQTIIKRQIYINGIKKMIMESPKYSCQTN